ncbi:MAG: tetratricopeptide repeat protein [Acidobacteriota bacterium]
MLLKRSILTVVPVALLSSLIPSAMADAVPVIVRGKVQMQDGSAPGKSVGTERVCSDSNGSGPGPLTDKAGVYTWRMEVDFMRSRVCYIHATLSGYVSTRVDISSLNPAKSVNFDLATITLSIAGSDPYQLSGADSDVPSKSRQAWKAAGAAVMANNIAEAAAQYKAAAEASPKYAPAWHNLGILMDFQRNLPEARKAYEQAIAADPKMMAPYVTLARLSIKEKDWATVTKSTAALIPLDKKRIFPEMYLHQAVAQYNLKDMAAAEASAKEALNPKEKQTAPRAEYVLGRIMESKGDMAGAKQHMLRYLELQPAAEDAALIKAHIDGLGQPGAPDPDLELIVR